MKRRLGLLSILVLLSSLLSACGQTVDEKAVNMTENALQDTLASTALTASGKREDYCIPLKQQVLKANSVLDNATNALPSYENANTANKSFNDVSYLIELILDTAPSDEYLDKTQSAARYMAEFFNLFRDGNFPTKAKSYGDLIRLSGIDDQGGTFSQDNIIAYYRNWKTQVGDLSKYCKV